MKFLTKVLLTDQQRMYIKNYDPDKCIKPDTLKPSFVRQKSMGDNLIELMPTNLSGKKQKLNFANLVDKFLTDIEKNKMTEMDEKILKEITQDLPDSKNNNFEQNQTWT
mmetsp:Transcript_17522/g.15441  ORF Transcript_17522/g.15441 Transcript_17522/m.15441 type:complete len:109 (+) Transcript_17522:1159-1485(+)